MTRSMNQEKIGKLIAKMRKQKGLTQRELGEMVGVGFRAVSKWERGLTMPDISIINELSTILGISSDELLKGELTHKDDKSEISITDVDKKLPEKNNKRLLLFVIPILMIIAIIGMIIIRNNNKPVEYSIQSLHPEEYQAEGTLTIEGEKLTIKINKIQFQDYEFAQTIINDYDYSLLLNNDYIFGINGASDYNNLYKNITIKKLCNFLTIKYDWTIPKKINSYDNKAITIIFKFYDNNYNMLEKQLELFTIKK